MRSAAVSLPVWAFWCLLLGPVLTAVGVRLPAWARALGRSRETVEKNQAKKLLKEANQAARSDSKQAIPLFERAIFEALFEKASLRARGILRSELARELTKSGVDSKLAQDVQSVLTDLEAARYGASIRGAQDDSVHEAQSLNQRVNEVTERILKMRVTGGRGK